MARPPTTEIEDSRRSRLKTMARIELHTHISAPIGICFNLSRDLDLHLESMTFSNERAIAGRTGGLIEDGEAVTWEARHLGRKWRMTSHITEMVSPTRFVDQMVEGPFAAYRHEHRFQESANGTRMIDVVDFNAPFGLLGKVADAIFVTAFLRRLLTSRNNLIKLKAEGT